MSSSPNVVAEPPSAPTAPPERIPDSAPAPIPGTSPSRSPKVLALLALALVVVSAFSVLLFKKATPRPNSHPAFSPPGAQAGEVRLKGTTQAIQARAILAPMLSGQQVGTLTITKLLTPGTRVKRGEVLVEFDRQAQMRDALDKEAEYRKLADQVAQEQAKEDAARAKDETELHQAESDLSKAELEMQKVELLSQIDSEKAQEDLDQAKATLQQLRETFDLKRKAARAAIRILEIQRDRTQQTMIHAQANAELMQVHSPLDGVVVLNTIWKEGKMGEVQEGDQVRPGVPFMQVVDPSRMQVAAQVNQEDFRALKVGQRVKVRLDAYPEMVFDGKLEQISPVARNGTFSPKVRTFTAIFSMEGNDPRLMPDLSAAVDVNLGNNSLASKGSR